MIRLRSARACLLLAGPLFLLPGPRASATPVVAPSDPDGRVPSPAHALAPEAYGHKYAVFIAGYGGDNNANTMSFMFKTLVNKYGYAKSDIYVLWDKGGTLDLDGDGQNDADYTCTRANIFTVFDILDNTRNVGYNDVVLVYADDHGSQDPNSPYESELCLGWSGQYFWAHEMDSVFTNLEDGNDPIYWPTLLGVFDQCYSGGFVDHMSERSQRAVCSASKAGESSWAPPDGYPSSGYNAFTYYWISAMNEADPNGNPVDADVNDDGHVSFREAFVYAEAHDEYHNGTISKVETPQYWEFEDAYGRWHALNTDIITWVTWAERGEPGIHGPAGWGDGGTGGPWGSGFAVVLGLSPPAGAAPDRSGGSVSGGEQVYLRVHNTGTEPVSGTVVRFYYGLPSTIASADDPTLEYIDSVPLGTLAPGDTVRAGPVSVPTLGLNPFSQPYWKLFAVVDGPQSPVESGWVFDDKHVAIENYYHGSSVTGEPVDLYYHVINPESEPRRVFLKLARNTLPSSWYVQSVPALGETLDVEPGAIMTAWLRVWPDGVHGPGGIVTVEEELLDYFTGCWAHCEGPEDSTFVSEGGYIRTTGGINFEVTAPYTEDVPETPFGLHVSLAYPNPSANGVTLAYSLPFRSPVRVSVYDVAGRRLQRGDLGEQGPGAYTFTWDGRDERGSLAPAGVYVLRLETREHAVERRVVVVR